MRFEAAYEGCKIDRFLPRLQAVCDRFAALGNRSLLEREYFCILWIITEDYSFFNLFQFCSIGTFAALGNRRLQIATPSRVTIEKRKWPTDHGSE